MAVCGNAEKEGKGVGAERRGKKGVNKRRGKRACTKGVAHERRGQRA